MVNNISRQSNIIQELITKLHGADIFLADKRITAGFDGFIDTLVRIIKTKETESSPVLFSHIGEFGNYILEKQGSSFSLETEEKSVRIGGNMPIMSHALGLLGVEVNCIGAFGHPQISSVFETISSKCQLYSFTDPGTSTAFEFNDGKIMLAQMGQLNTIGWEELKKRIGLDTLCSLFAAADLVCLVNWSEIDMSTEIWKGLLKDILPAIATDNRKRKYFFDLSDCSKRSPAAINEALGLIKEFSRYAYVILGLNRNETRMIYQCLHDAGPAGELHEAGKAIYEKLKPGALLLHSAKEALLFTAQGEISAGSFFIDDPKISTGAGDNFNAGFCVAQLLELDAESALVFANAVAGYYIRNGASPGLPELVPFLEQAAMR